MTRIIRGLGLFAFAMAMSGQQISTGLESPWDARKLIGDALRADQDLRPLLNSLHPQQWYEQKGAPSTYVIQWQSAQQQIQYVEQTAATASQHIESLPAILDLYFRMEALESSARSLNEGAQRYAARSDAEKLDRWVGSAFEARRRLREYTQDLATSIEQNFKIADEEAQRCRGMITKTPAPAKRSRTQ